MKPGIYPDISFEEYASWRLMNFSTLKHGFISTDKDEFGVVSTRQIKHAWENDSGDSDARRTGRAFHVWLLEYAQRHERFLIADRCTTLIKTGEHEGEPCGKNASFLRQLPDIEERMESVEKQLRQRGFKRYEKTEANSRYYINGGEDRYRVSDHEANGKTKRWMEQNAVKSVVVTHDVSEFGLDRFLSRDWFCGTHKPKKDVTEPHDFIGEDKAASLDAMVESVKHEDIVNMFKHRGGYEVSAVFELNGVKCKGRMDKFISKENHRDPVIIDIKKMGRTMPSLAACRREVRMMRYHVQASFYVDAIKQTEGYEPRMLWIFIQEKPPFEILPLEATKRNLDIGRMERDIALREWKKAVGDNVYLSAYQEVEKDALEPWYNDKFGSVFSEISG